MLPLHHDDAVKRRYMFAIVKDKIFAWIHLILSDKNSRNLLGFLLVNLTFAFVELFYGLFTNCLGLISDSFHMFFDCTGLLGGLVATVITKWKADERFSYGYVRAEILAGLINGLFLLFVAFFILTEALERLVEPPNVKHEHVIVVSVLGFIINLIGIFIFHHGHSHGGGSSHEHSHDHGHSHAISSDSQIMKGVFLHILADTLGSLGVILSAVLMHLYNWMIADPICSIFIAFLIAVSIMSLLSDSLGILMQRQPKQLDHLLPDCYNKVLQLKGVQGIQETHFWTLCTNAYVGGLILEVSNLSDPKYIVSHTQMIFRSIGVTNILVQLDYEYSQMTYQNLRKVN